MQMGARVFAEDKKRLDEEERDQSENDNETVRFGKLFCADENSGKSGSWLRTAVDIWVDSFHLKNRFFFF